MYEFKMFKILIIHINRVLFDSSRVNEPVGPSDLL
jgi:hypothetical protein